MSNLTLLKHNHFLMFKKATRLKSTYTNSTQSMPNLTQTALECFLCINQVDFLFLLFVLLVWFRLENKKYDTYFLEIVLIFLYYSDYIYVYNKINVPLFCFLVYYIFVIIMCLFQSSNSSYHPQVKDEWTYVIRISN